MRETLAAKVAEMSRGEIEIPLEIGGKAVRTGQARRMPEAARAPARAREVPQRRRRTRSRPRPAPRRPRGPPGRRRRGRTARRSSSSAADLLAGPWRATLNAATMLGQSKNAYQAEIDSACELIDFFRFNVQFLDQIYAEQPLLAARRVEPDGVPAARGVRVRGHAVQLHRDRGQPAVGAGARRQRRHLEARVERDVSRRTS